MVALLVVAGLLLIGFALVQAFLPKTATLPPRIFLQRSILAGFIFAFFTGSHMMLFSESYSRLFYDWAFLLTLENSLLPPHLVSSHQRLLGR